MVDIGQFVGVQNSGVVPAVSVWSQSGMLHETKRTLSCTKPIPRIFLIVGNVITNEMVIGNHSKVSETPDVSERTFGAEVEDRGGKLNP